MLACVLLLAAFGRAEAQNTVALDPAVAFITDVTSRWVFDARSPTNPSVAGLTWESVVQAHVFNLLSTESEQKNNRLLQYKVDPYTMVRLYRQHFLNDISPNLIPIDRAIFNAMIADLAAMRLEAKRVRDYDRTLEDKTDAYVFNKTKQLADASVLAPVDAATGAEKPVVTVRDFTDMVDRAAYLYVGAVVHDEQQKTGKSISQIKYEVAQDRRFLLFENINNQIKGKTDPSLTSRYDATLAQQRLPSGKLDVQRGAVSVDVANKKYYEEKEVEDTSK